MTAENEKNTKPTDNGAARRAATKTATVSERARQDSQEATSKAKSSARDAEEAATSGVRSAGDATRSAGRAAAAAVEGGQRAVVATAGKAASTALTTWTVIKNRKAIATGAAAGLAGVAGAAFALGRHTARPQGGPLTRLVRGNF
ncbi:hypothetical protein [Streptomyces sp. NPDC051219]|uniref:hypothetical protein n=1 Tax=Streptomyces sp. NPDC051219 TaxID=3155283 RepID=UPI00344A5AA7